MFENKLNKLNISIFEHFESVKEYSNYIFARVSHSIQYQKRDDPDTSLTIFDA